jgi:hypothetical protein
MKRMKKMKTATQPNIEAIDPMRILDMAKVERRTGYCRRKIMALLAEDAKHQTPGVHFAAPMRRPDVRKLEWREITLIRWMEKQEKSKVA